MRLVWTDPSSSVVADIHTTRQPTLQPLQGHVDYTI